MSEATTAVDFRAPVPLGTTALRVSRIGFGGSYGAPAQAYERAFQESGVNVFYWGSIRRRGMGDAIRRLCKSGARDRLVVALQSYDRTGFLMRPFVERGLAALGLGHADLLILGYHDGPPSARVLDAARQLVVTGRVRYLAMSGHNRTTHGDLAADPARPFDALMFRYNAAHRGAETEILPYLTGTGRPGAIGYTATSWGQLLDPRRMPPGEAPLTAATCYRFVLSQPRIDVCLAGPSNADHVREACRAVDLGPLDAEEAARVRRIGDFVTART